jgi:hypothetical protein
MSFREGRAHRHGSMLASLDQVSGDRCLPECLAGFQPMQPFNEDKPLAIRPHENGRFLSFRQHALCQGATFFVSSV